MAELSGPLPNLTGGAAGPSGALTGDQQSSAGDNLFGDFVFFGSGDGARTNTKSTAAAGLGTLILYGVLGIFGLGVLMAWVRK